MFTQRKPFHLKHGLPQVLPAAKAGPHPPAHPTPGRFQPGRTLASGGRIPIAPPGREGTEATAPPRVPAAPTGLAATGEASASNTAPIEAPLMIVNAFLCMRCSLLFWERSLRRPIRHDLRLFSQMTLHDRIWNKAKQRFVRL